MRAAPPDVGRLERACAAMVHRGPDDGDIWVKGKAGLGHRRLAILDLSAAGRQPMADADDSLVVAFNGEIYNYRELRAEIGARARFRTATDTEVLLHGYREWGWQGLLSRIDGMFAFAIWDARQETLYAARDRLGKKPLFYRLTGDGLLFASTLEAVLELAPDRPPVHKPAVDAYLTYQAVPAPLTIYEGVHQLNPAHCFSYQARQGTFRSERYWDVSYAAKDFRRSEADTLDALDSLLRAAVRRRLLSDVPLGAFLSGGVDSSLVVALMAQESAGKVSAVCVGFDDRGFDERPFARRVASACGVELHEHVLHTDFVSHLPEIVWQYGQPVADESIVPTYRLAQIARQHVTVALNGDGGDEVFGGYARPLVARAAAHYRRWVPAGVRSWLGGRVDPSRRDRLRKLRLLVAAGHGSAVDAFHYERAFGPLRSLCYAPELSAAVTEQTADCLYTAAWRRPQGVDDVDRTLYGELVTYLPDQLLAKMDVSTMAHGLEARSPLLDRAVVEFAATIPTALRLKRYETKYLLKRLARRYVPRDVLYRRKRGFVIPLRQWLRGDLAPYVSAVLRSSSFADRQWLCPQAVDLLWRQHSAGTHDWSQQLWTAFVLELWARMALDRSLRRSDSLHAVLN